MNRNMKNYLLVLITATIVIGSILLLKKDNAIEVISTTKDYAEMPMNSDPNEDPVMYDFLYSSIGYKMNHNINDYGNLYAIMVNDHDLAQDYGRIYVEFYAPLDMYPAIGTKPKSIELTKSDWEKVKLNLMNWNNDLVFPSDDGWKLYLVTQNFEGEEDFSTYTSDSLGNYWSNINLNVLYENGWYQENLKNGWNSDWIRREPFASQINYNRNTDVHDVFYDKFRLDEIIELDHIESDEKRLVQVNGVNKFKTLNGIVWKMELEQLNIQLESEGFEKIIR